MKIRTGFVSNSSSSSFIVDLPQIPKSAKEMAEMIFGNKEYFEFDIFKKELFSTKKIGEILFKRFEFNSAKYRKNLQNDIQTDLLHSIIESMRKEDLVFFDDGPAWKEYLTRVNKYRIQLEMTFPNINWMAKFNIVLKYIEKLVAEENKYKDKIQKLIKNLRNNGQNINNDEKYKKLNNKISKIWHEMWIPTKTMTFIVNKLVDIFLEKQAAGYITISDDTDIGCAMENGGIFDKFNHIRFNNH
jgi:hypothetical protein